METGRLCMCESYARATERAALAGARWLGRADQESAEESAFSGMEAALNQLPISGSVVIGAGDVEAGSALSGTVGAGGERVDLALDPLEGRGVVARGGNGAISMIVVGEPGKLRHLPDMYMRSIAASESSPSSTMSIPSSGSATWCRAAKTSSLVTMKRV